MFVYGIIYSAMGYVAGVFTGVFGKFGADWLTDIRRNKASIDKLNSDYYECTTQMPKLIEEMKSDLKKIPLAREFWVMPFSDVTINLSKQIFTYSCEEHEELINKVERLKICGLVTDLACDGCIYKYRMEEYFIKLLRGYENES